MKRSNFNAFTIVGGVLHRKEASVRFVSEIGGDSYGC